MPSSPPALSPSLPAFPSSPPLPSHAHPSSPQEAAYPRGLFSSPGLPLAPTVLTSGGDLPLSEGSLIEEGSWDTASEDDLSQAEAEEEEETLDEELEDANPSIQDFVGQDQEGDDDDQSDDDWVLGAASDSDGGLDSGDDSDDDDDD